MLVKKHTGLFLWLDLSSAFPNIKLRAELKRGGDKLVPDAVPDYDLKNDV